MNRKTLKLWICLLIITMSSVHQTLSAQQHGNTSNMSAFNTQSEAYLALGHIDEAKPQTFNYNQTPKFALGKRSAKFWHRLNAAQMLLLEQYQVPKYISYGMKHLERDIMQYQKAMDMWDKNNIAKKEEIISQLINLQTPPATKDENDK